ncbi:uncharacterized protein LOC120267365 [Dioscorea cayenensis subsp. rotundata]|uniref:Uncharacterized protein LOC120267365 n=1 Tax=Dioscorea cayennensis subsp. rotundata TaxID=55577 RepID=A0AB40BU24_DIOCR|nr:uncharacterized protein LOC120267365 [Dioscorea cayenensis subsp. rotundata]
MVHLPIHLAWEAKVGGPVNYRWMYSVERYMHKLKGYVHNKSRPEGSIAEGYIAEECLTFCSRYLHGIETKFNGPERNYDGDSLSRNTSSFQIFCMFGQPFGKANMQELSNDLLNAAIFYILQNCEDVQSFISEHKNILSEKGVRNIDNIHKCEFSSWFHKRIGDAYNENDEGIDINMLALARGPERRVICYPGYNINGFRFHTRDRDENKKTQNCGVMVKGEGNEGELSYYGIILDIIELRYTGGNKVTLFRCDWYDTSREGIGYRKDRYGIVSVNTTQKLHTNEPFVLASQVTQVYYIKGLKDPTWATVSEIKPRNLYEIPENEEEPYQEEYVVYDVCESHSKDDFEDIDWNKHGVEDMIVE